ncbi:MAG: DnaA/Hda family protein [Wenzhouxiangellaceae bacterium]
MPLALVPPRRPRLENFIAGPNRSLLATLEQAAGDAQWYLLCGPEGSGKSHLAGALEHAWTGRGVRVMFISLHLDHGRTLLGHAADQSDVPGAAIVDGIEQLVGDQSAERALFNALNRWRAVRCTVLMTARSVPDYRLPDLNSRIAQAARLNLRPLRDQDLAALVTRLLLDHGLVAGRGLGAYLLRYGPRAPQRMVALFEEMARRSAAERRPVTVRLARESLIALGWLKSRSASATE